MTVFELTKGEEFKIQFQNDESGYKKVGLIYEDDGDIILELESINNGNIPLVTDEPQPPTPTKKPPTATRPVQTSSPHTRLAGVEWYDSCRGAIWMELTGFAPNSQITVYSNFYNQNCETEEWYAGTWTQTYDQRTDSNGNLVIGYKIGKGDHNYTFTDKSGYHQTLSFKIEP